LPITTTIIIIIIITHDEEEGQFTVFIYWALDTQPNRRQMRSLHSGVFVLSTTQ
jgi:hypothetical protein